MEIIKINTNAIKVILNSEESRCYDFITDDEISDDKLLKSVDSLLSKIEMTEKIDLIKNKLLIQVYPLKNSYCEIYICDTEEKSMYKDRGAPNGFKRGNTYTSVYSFDSLDKMLTVCHRLSAITDEGGAQAYYDENTGSYYLICKSISPRELRFAFINEYARQLKSSYAHHVREHTRCICDTNAVEILAGLI